MAFKTFRPSLRRRRVSLETFEPEFSHRTWVCLTQHLPLTLFLTVSGVYFSHAATVLSHTAATLWVPYLLSSGRASSRQAVSRSKSIHTSSLSLSHSNWPWVTRSRPSVWRVWLWGLCTWAHQPSCFVLNRETWPCNVQVRCLLP